MEKIADDYKGYLKVEGANAEYPVMKCLDMFLWQVGFELDISNSFEGAKDEKKTKLIEQANKVGIAGNTEGEITDKIKSRWGLI